MATWLSFISILCLLHLQIYAPQAYASDPFTKFSMLYLPYPAVGPKSPILDRDGQGPYVGVADGRILKYNGTVFEYFAHTSPERTERECFGARNIRKCGRPSSLAYHSKTGNIYIADPFVGLCVVGPQGGLATLLATEAYGVKFKFLNGVSVDELRDKVYFTEYSYYETYEQYWGDIQFGRYRPETTDSTGKLYQYDASVERSTFPVRARLLHSFLQYPVGPAVTEDGDSVVFGRFGTRYVEPFKRNYAINEVNGSVLEYLLTEPRNQVVIRYLGEPYVTYPRSIRRAPKVVFDTFWAAVSLQRPDGRYIHYGYKFDINGRILIEKELSSEFPSRTDVPSDLQEYGRNVSDAKLYVGSEGAMYLGLYTYA